MMSKLLFVALVVLAMLGVAQATGGNFEVSGTRQTEGTVVEPPASRRCANMAERCSHSMRMLTCYYCCAVLLCAAVVCLAPLPPLPLLRLAAIRRCLFRRSSHAAPPLPLVVALYFSLVAD